MRFILTSMFVIGFAGLGVAQDAERYTLERDGDNFVRLDKRTGAISTCTQQSGQLVCRLAADDRLALEDEMDRLREQLTDLERRIVALEKGQPAKDLPSDEEFDRTMSYMQRFFRGFLDIVKEFDRDLRGGEEQVEPAPNKT
ncbi:MAG: hypothetical protein KF874_14455 [Rhizobiaceae bacterium]|nr:hypothetical protein [Rhizobiaceae bacterium]